MLVFRAQELGSSGLARLSGRFVAAAAFVSLGLLAGCAASGGSVEDHSHINIVEPGDTTMSCDDLKKAIADMELAVDHLQADYTSAQTAETMTEAATSYSTPGAYQGQYSALFGSIDSVMKAMNRSHSHSNVEKAAELLGNAKARRESLAGIYNQRCF
jgi:hypothetical protein